jgi:hexosaminidase
MRRGVGLVVLVLLFSFSVEAVGIDSSPVLDLMPVPAEVEAGSTAFHIDSTFSVSIQGGGATPRLKRAVRRMLRRLSDRSTLFFEPTTFLDLGPRSGTSMTLRVERAGLPALGEDESYRLTVAAERIRLEAETDIGAIRGIETFLQLLVFDENGLSVTGVSVTDRPRFQWRGLMIDSSRHFMPVGVIKRNLDGMAAVKLNVFHWHLADDQGFRVQCLASPELHELASDGLFYTRAQVRDIIAYATDRGIRVVPEFDLPGHATAWLTARPDIGSAPGPYEIERSWGIFDAAVNPTIEETYAFLTTFFGEMATLFDDEYIHIGGDENNGEHWLANPEIVRFMEEHGFEEPPDLQRHFNERVVEILAANGKRMIGWDEILQEGLPKTAVIQSWRGPEALVDAARRGYSGILSAGYYVDLNQSAEFHYLNDPFPDGALLGAEQRARILGGEATMWAEFVSPENIDSRIWPRTAAIAERLWSPADVRDVPDMYRRLDIISLELEELGLQHERNRPMMLRRLCRCRDVEPLEALLGVIEPVKNYRRNELRAHTQFSPLTRMVDVAWPDAGPARRFREAVARMLGDGPMDPADVAAIRQSLMEWEANATELSDILKNSPGLAEVAPMSMALTQISKIGLEALDSLMLSDVAPGIEWLAPRIERLEAARQPWGQMELMIVDPVRDLLCAVTWPASATVDACSENPTAAMDQEG